MVTILLVLSIMLYELWALRKVYLDKKNGICCGSVACSDCIVKGKCKN